MTASRREFEAVDPRNFHFRADDRDANFTEVAADATTAVNDTDRNGADEDFRRINHLESFIAVLSSHRNTDAATRKFEWEPGDTSVHDLLIGIEFANII